MNLDRAIQLAAEAHEGQVDKQGQPYILHPLRVMLALAGDEEDMIVGVLHDVLEDTWLRPDSLEEVGLSEDLMLDVLALTRDASEQYAGYIERVAERPRSARIKVADLQDNLDRLSGLPPADQ